MTEKLDKSGVIEALTEGIGGILGRRVRSSFYKLLERLETMPECQRQPLIIQQHIVDILALSIIYNQIVVPLESSRGFLRLARESGADHVRIAKHKLDARFIRSASKCSAGFYTVLNESKIPSHMLEFATLKDLINNVFLSEMARRSPE